MFIKLPGIVVPVGLLPLELFTPLFTSPMEIIWGCVKLLKRSDAMPPDEYAVNALESTPNVMVVAVQATMRKMLLFSSVIPPTSVIKTD